ncbi:MAG: hypothetical protein GTO14_08670 [Anaerolineales bacterium]|nr:hypothetical protein [Anaerolineales bacterium]
MIHPLIALLIAMASFAICLALFWPERGLVNRILHNRRLTERVLIEDALKHIHSNEMERHHISVKSVAGALRVSASKAAEILVKMETSQLLTYQEGRPTLTPNGRNAALHILRAHRVWERYLAETTGLSEAEWHDRAETHEHRLSPEELNALSAQLSHPTHDPHGDPIPTADGEYVSHGGIPLTSVDENTLIRIVHIEDEPAELFAQIVAVGLHPGMQIWVIEKSTERIRFWANGDEHVLAPIVANNLSVVLEPEQQAEDVFPCKRLSCLEPGQKALVLGISPASRGAERRRLMDLGLLRGTIVQADFSSPNGDPIAYRIRGALIALRKDQADLIYIDDIIEADV